MTNHLATITKLLNDKERRIANKDFASRGVIPLWRDRLCKLGAFPINRDKLYFYSSSVLVDQPSADAPLPAGRQGKRHLRVVAKPV